ncbi:MAG: PSD1 and planctomycete cytochrome C domain-containing protein [Pirellulales bacterium]
MTTWELKTITRLSFAFVLSTTMLTVAAEVQNQNESDLPINFADDVFPILQRSCIECHGPEKQEGDLRLDRREDVFKSSVIKSGSPADSEILRRISLPRGHDEIMPAVGEPLQKKHVTIIRNWIQQGAIWPKDFQPGKHWAYVAPIRPMLPNVSQSGWAQSPIDYFVLHRLDEKDLSPSTPASPEKLIRRVYLDLIGLPPSPADVQAFVDDPNSAAFEAVVDDLLQRPQFGERWARPWLDLARYADSHGFQRDNLRDIWAYRDWVIQAMNADMPFDQFTLEQIAGDLLPNATESQRIATGFHRCAPTNVEAGSIPEETRVEQVIDRVNTTGAVWLGTTLECCQCHDHKYDPFSSRDYYQLLAFYNSTELEADRASKSPSSIRFNGPSMPLSDPVRDTRREELSKQLATIREQHSARQRELGNSLNAWVAEFSKQITTAPRTHTLEVMGFESQGNTDSFEKLEDGSVLLVGGDPPATDVYTVRTQANLFGVNAFRLDVLRHDKLPGKGPGRGDPKRRNFVLNDFSVHVASKGKPEREVAFSSATATFSQKNWDVKGAIDDDPKSGWAIAPKFDESHSATFRLSEPINLRNDVEVKFTLTQKYGAARMIGCFRLSAMTGNIDADAIPDFVVKAVETQPNARSKKQRKQLIDYRAERDSRTIHLTKQLASIQKEIDQVKPETTLVMIELDKKRMSSVFQRGDYRKPGEEVQPGTPAVLHPMPNGPTNRITLAKWLTSQDNPLVARVTVNRWWAELFGQGLVTTIEDFGIKGEPPSHPELLDWLAVEFMENGWSMKTLLKTIVMSATYQQSSQVTKELREVDHLNQLLARGPRFRMDAEMIRDNALAISGLINLRQFGPPIRPYQPDGIWKKVGGTAYSYDVSPGSEQHRRGIYVVIKRGSPYPSFVNFDATARLACTVKRCRTNTPLQALTLLNDPVYVEAARSLAEHVQREHNGPSLKEQIRYAYQLCTARQPTEREEAILQKLFQRQKEMHDEDEAWFAISTTLLNLHETITKD